MSTIDTSPAELRALADAVYSVEHDGGRTVTTVETVPAIAAADALRALAAEKEAAPELLAALSGLLSDIEALVRQSEGVAGLHLNGDVAPWADLLPGGRYEAWLATVADARAALAKVEGQS